MNDKGNWKDFIFLIIDDNEDSRIFLKTALDLKSAGAYEASSGEDALKLLKEVAKIDIVLLDIHMPGFSGFEVLFEIKKNYPETCVIAVTADISSERVLTESQFDDIIFKPVRINDFEEKISRQIKRIKRGKLSLL